MRASNADHEPAACRSRISYHLLHGDCMGASISCEQHLGVIRLRARNRLRDRDDALSVERCARLKDFRACARAERNSCVRKDRRRIPCQGLVVS
jgi:hypothetical protein